MAINPPEYFGGADENGNMESDGGPVYSSQFIYYSGKQDLLSKESHYSEQVPGIIEAEKIEKKLDKGDAFH